MIYELCCVAAIGLHMASVHINPTKELVASGINSNTEGAYVVFNDGITIGTLKNTNSKQAYYFGQTYKFNKYTQVIIGGITGYNKPIIPYLVPSIDIPLYNKFAFKISYIPKINITQAHVLFFSIEKTL